MNFEKSSASRMEIAITTCRDDTAYGLADTARLAAWIAPLPWYQLPTWRRNAIAITAAMENHAMLDCPRGSTMNAASSGPSDDPKVAADLEERLREPMPTA